MLSLWSWFLSLCKNSQLWLFWNLQLSLYLQYFLCPFGQLLSVHFKKVHFSSGWTCLHPLFFYYNSQCCRNSIYLMRLLPFSEIYLSFESLMSPVFCDLPWRRSALHCKVWKMLRGGVSFRRVLHQQDTVWVHFGSIGIHITQRSANRFFVN